MWKIIRHGVSIGCLLVAVVAVCFWVRSYFVAQYVLVPIPSIDPDYGVITDFNKGQILVIGMRTRGRLYINNDSGLDEVDLNDDNSYIFRHMRSWAFISRAVRPGDVGSPTLSDHLHRNGIRFAGFGVSVVAGEVVALIPIWQIVLLSLLFPALDGIMHIRQRKSLPPICCSNCHYDLRASTATCPECGTPIQRQAGTTS